MDQRSCNLPNFLSVITHDVHVARTAAILRDRADGSACDDRATQFGNRYKYSLPRMRQISERATSPDSLEGSKEQRTIWA